eukprot:gene11095-biopygen15869
MRHEARRGTPEEVLVWLPDMEPLAAFVMEALVIEEALLDAVTIADVEA